MSYAIFIAIYLAIPALSIWISGRQYVWQGLVIFLLFWPVAWLFMGPEELP
jgi:hypothetical protein